MFLVQRPKKPKIVAFSNDEVRSYKLQLKSGLSIKLRATHVTDSNSLYLFMFRQIVECFFEIPKSAVEDLELLPLQSEDGEPVFGVTEPTLQKYAVELPDKHLCYIIASTDKKEGCKAQFLCHKTPFLTIYNAKGCKFDFTSWESSLNDDPIHCKLKE